MFRQLFEETVYEIENDMDFRRLNRIEAKIQYILLIYIHGNELRQIFDERRDIVRNARKSYEESMQCYERAFAEYEKICQEITAGTLSVMGRRFRLAKVLTEIESAIIYAPFETQPNHRNILIDAYILRMKAHLKSGLKEKFIHDYIQLMSICGAMGLTEQFDTEAEDIKDLITPDIRERMQESMHNIDEGVEEADLMPSLKMDERCVFVSHPDRGRYMIAIEQIDERVPLLEEMPQIYELDFPKLGEYCSYCFVRLQKGFHPCFGCTECRFCDIKCALKASEGFHRFECSIIGYIKDRFNSNWLLGYRVMTSLGIDTINQLYGHFTNDGQDFDLNDWILRNINKNVQKTPELIVSQYKGLSTFVEHSYRYPIRDFIFMIFDAIEIALLIEQTHVFRDLTSDQHLIRLAAMLFKHYSKCISNVFSWEEMNQSTGRYLSLVSTMVNHSCCPNTFWDLTKGKQTLTSIMPIEKGDEISISYGMFAFPNRYVPFIERQRHLRTIYNFVCDCSWDGNGCKPEKASLVSILKCRECGGTVYYGYDNPNRMCIDCGQFDPNGFYDNRYNNVIRKLIFCFNYLVDRDFHTERTIFYAEQVVDLMSERCESSSPDLLRMRLKLNDLYIQPFSQDTDTELTEFFG